MTDNEKRARYALVRLGDSNLINLFDNGKLTLMDLCNLANKYYGYGYADASFDIRKMPIPEFKEEK
jgi:hypothetical protein